MNASGSLPCGARPIGCLAGSGYPGIRDSQGGEARPLSYREAALDGRRGNGRGESALPAPELFVG